MSCNFSVVSVVSWVVVSCWFFVFGTDNIPKIDPEKTFCEQTTYLEFLLSNAKDEEEAEHIKATINDYLDLYNDKDKEITEEE